MKEIVSSVERYKYYFRKDSICRTCKRRNTCKLYNRATSNYDATGDQMIDSSGNVYLCELSLEEATGISDPKIAAEIWNNM